MSSLEDNGVPSGEREDADAQKPGGVCADVRILSGFPAGVKGNVQGNLFKIITQADTHYFIQAPSRQEKMDWIDAIRKHT